MENKKRIIQLSADVVIPDGITTDEVIEKITKEYEKLGVRVVGFMQTDDASWSFEEYGIKDES